MDGSNYLHEVWLGAETQGVDDCPKSIQNGGVICGLLVECGKQAVNELVSEILLSVTDF